MMILVVGLVVLAKERQAGDVENQDTNIAQLESNASAWKKKGKKKTFVQSYVLYLLSRKSKINVGWLRVEQYVGSFEQWTNPLNYFIIFLEIQI
jgi:hypothetical protein